MASDFGHAGKLLRVNLSSGAISHIPTDIYSDRFIGGRGLAAKIYWDLVPPHVRAFDPENCLIIVTGPLAGVSGFSSTRWQLYTKSPATDPERFNYCNIGGHWGAQLKFAGYDGLIVEGCAEKPVYLFIRDDVVEIRDASHLWGKSTIEAREAIKSELGRDVRVLATGQAGENRVPFASVLADSDSSGGGGSGAVMGAKKLKAIAVRGTGRVRVANPEKVRDLVEHVRSLKEPTPGALERLAPKGGRKRREACFGCVGSCTSRVNYEAEDGTRGKFMCESSLFYKIRAQRFYGQENEVPFFATKLCDAYGLDTMLIETTVMWLVRCLSGGVLNDENTGLPLSKIGSLEFIEALTRKIALREGFGDILANGPVKAAELVGPEASKLIGDYISSSPTHQFAAYGPRTFITTGIFYMMEPRQPIQQLHEISRLLGAWNRRHLGQGTSYMSTELFRGIAKRFWGSEEAADFSTYDGKALAAKMIQDRQYAKESLILCDFAWPITNVDCSEDHMGDPTVEHRLYSAVMGQEMDEDGLYRVGERALNMQRAVLAREGHMGRKSDVLKEIFYTTPLRNEFTVTDLWTPGKDGEPFQKKGWVVDREKFENLKTEYYQLRRWDPETGLQTTSQLSELRLEDIVPELAKHGAVVDS